MKKITLAGLFVFSVGIAQKTTNSVQILPQVSAKVDLNETTQIATLTMTGPSDRWFALTLGSFGAPGAMSAGNDVVYFDGATLVDATHNGLGTAPTPDAQNDWTVTNNEIAAGVRTLVATRSFAGGPNDFSFDFSATEIDLAAAHAETAIMAPLQYHGVNRANMQNVAFETLGVAENSLRATRIFPNPSSGNFTVSANAQLTRISIYTHTGSLVRTIEVNSGSNAQVNISGLQTGTYLMELVNDTGKAWKKVIVE